ncbi:TadE/TadG family type IV pilus assembly protein [Consotaella salsifontis]|uniref:Flp pilus assembly protein TadG n=1 Tax=Consotaella salsifontis TaxID=1365950 RepID=A0A1T4MFI1_9HYPH|nr:TadE/TadG family type IV pilus assembly protein [Consotaella salsifontis]SJZ65617.1 Flp pilus assembly protein TadG [Consotaella salsifontis]
MRHGAIARFLGASEGNIPILTAALLVPMMLIAGGAIDLVAYQTKKITLQDALDRGVLAAAALSQTKDSKDTVIEYLKASSLSNAAVSVEDDHSTNAKAVNATARLIYNTTFLKIAGIDKMNIVAQASAEEQRKNIEISLLLDISGSMLDNGGIYQLKPAAKEFINTILKEDVRAMTSVNLVPYAGEVNVGHDMWNFLAGGSYKRAHAYPSSCFEFLNGDFKIGVTELSKRDQVPHFTYYNYKKSGKEPWWCPTDDTPITYLSNDPQVLGTAIDNLKVFDGTGTAYAMKWATMLLDPAMRPTLNAASYNGLISSSFPDRPADYGDQETMKVIVLMTDGQIGFQQRPTNNRTFLYEPQNASNFKELFSQSKAQAQLDSLCTDAKGKGIRIFTIGFKLTNSVAAKLATCASSASDAYRADGVDIADAFKSIATSIQKLKLTK